MSQSKIDLAPPEVRAAIKEAAERGDNWEAIAKMLIASGVPTSETAVRRWANANGVKVNRAPDTTAFEERRAKAEAGDTKEALKLQVEHLQAELQAASREVKKAQKAGARDFAIGQMVQDVVERRFDAGRYARVKPYEPRTSASGTAQEFLALVSDAHYGEVVDPELAMGLSYNPEVARLRMAELRDKIIRYAELRPYEISVLHLAVLGDMVSGNNHEDLDVTNAIGQADQAMEVAEIAYGMVQDFAGFFPRVEVSWVSGNHGRIHKVPRHKQRFENWDYVAGRALQTMCRMGLDDRTVVTVPRGARHIIDVCGRRIALMHGDGVKAQSFAGIPFYSLKTKHDALQAMMRALDLPPVDGIAIGHFHQHLHWPGVCVMNGSIKGGDEYVQDTRLAHTPPQQIIQEYHPRYGLTCTDYIELGHIG